jgi:hypothetical protein
MKKSDYGVLFLISLVFFILLATLQRAPGYMDAEYYLGQSIRLVQHHDLIEPFIWNFLNDPVKVDSQGFAFWLPATSFIAAGGLMILGSTSFYAARLFFILMAACIPMMTAFFATRFLPKKRAGWLAGLLTMFSGFYLPFITITDTFTPYMFFGGLFFISIWFAEKKINSGNKLNYWFIGTGLIAGLMSLTRSDGLLWLAGGWLGVLIIVGIKPWNWQRISIHLGLVLIGFALVMTPWILRNYAIYNSLFPPGNGLMLWLTKYDDLFVYPSKQLYFSSWISSGFGNILVDRLKALAVNLQTIIASGGTIILTPIFAIGLWKHRKSNIVRLTLVILIAILGVMTLVFPYAGERGGFFHSLSAVQVILWSMVPFGLDTIIQWGVKNRNWKTDRSWKMFGAALVVVTGIFSTLLIADKLNNGTESGIPWNKTQDAFATIDQRLSEKTSDEDGVIMVNNPPGFTLATGRSSVMIPTGGASSLIEVSKRYDVHYLVLNSERADITEIFEKEESSQKHFKFLFEIAENRVYEFNP